MVVGVCTVELYLPDGHSLKSKRQILSSLKARLNNKFNISIAEVGEQDLWQKSTLGIACVANEAGYVNAVLDQVLNAIRSYPTLELLQSRIELL
ncbi:MAG: DUF503 domain-containing protein [Nitrospirae bacterium]|jgi:uncharacterized protein YlxP (DUF503 family)|nr:DUF503 domain-containing protein [Nitrospirota bacterium]